MSETNEAVIKPPYLSYTTLKNFLSNFKEGVIPSRIDKSLMLGQSGATQSYLLNALQFFQLIDEKGVPKEALQTLIPTIGDEPAYKIQWGKVFINGYNSIIDGLDLAKATPDELKERLKPFGYGGDTLRKCHVFFIAAAEAGGIPLANHLKKVGRAAPASKRGPNKRAQQQALPLQEHEEKQQPKEQVIPEGMSSATLPLNASGKRYFRMDTPVTITAAELQRIQQWLSFQLIVTENPALETVGADE